MSLDWPLMRNNIQREDLDVVIEFLKQDDPILTQSSQVHAFEEEWSNWLGVKYSVFVNSGSSANLLSMAVLRELCGTGEVIVPVGDYHTGSALPRIMLCGHISSTATPSPELDCRNSWNRNIFFRYQ